MLLFSLFLFHHFSFTFSVTLWLFSSIFLASMHLGIFSICASILFLRYWIIFTIITLSSFFWWIGYLHLVVFLGFYLVPSSGIYSSAVLSYLTFCDCSCHSPGCSGIVLLFFFFASSVCPLVHEVIYEACKVFLVEGPYSCLLESGAGSCSSDGQGCAQEDFKKPVSWSVGLCSPLLDIWTRVSQHWNLQAVGWGCVLKGICWPPGGFMLMRTCQTCCYKFFVPAKTLEP